MEADDPAAVRFSPLTTRKYSDTLLIFLMKGAMPSKYADRREVTHKGGQTIKFG